VFEDMKRHKYLLDGSRLKLSMSRDQVTKNKWVSLWETYLFGRVDLQKYSNHL
jgi:hypothetical protein